MAKRLYGGSIEVTPPAAPNTSVTDSIVNIPGIFKVQGTAIDAASIAVLEAVTASAAELNIMDGVTSTTAELNILDGVTSTAAELNILDGVTATYAELNILDGVTSTAAELNILDGVTSTAAELNILDGVTATAAELNLVDNVAANVTVAYAASATTDGIEATFTVKDAAGATIAAIHRLAIYISDQADGSALTSTAASGALTATVGEIHSALVAKKSVLLNTATTGIATLLLVDSANTAGERFCVINPVNGKVIVGAATVGTDYEGGV